MYVLLKMYVLLELLPKKNNAGTVKVTKNARTAMDMASLTIHSLDATLNVLFVADLPNETTNEDLQTIFHDYHFQFASLNTFKNNTNLESIYLGTNTSDIDEDAILNCPALKSIYIPSSTLTLSGTRTSSTTTTYSFNVYAPSSLQSTITSLGLTYIIWYCN